MKPYDQERDDDGIVYDADGNVVDGHHRLAARQYLLDVFRTAIERIEADTSIAAFSSLVAAQDPDWVWGLVCDGHKLSEFD